MYKLFIVDDNPLERRGVAGLLEWQTFGCEVAGLYASGSEALEAAEREAPDIVLTDVQMPAMDGIALGARLREDYPGTQLIFLSGHDSFSFIRGALRLEAADYVLKPVRKPELQTALEKAAARLSREREAAAERERLLRQAGVDTSEAPDADDADARSYHDRIVMQIKRIVAERYQEPLTVQDIADELYLSLSHTNNIFRRKTGQKIFDYLTAYRMERAKALLRQPDSKIYCVAQTVGYANKSHFCLVFKKHSGRTPSEYKNHYA
ncbi:response regulator transcription factor [Cohnella rhizosphaerae]|uniref:Response regulator n=1 Tax=Cohnella rhizosphaerae TaxID=1457232 RepID=A0A9X4KP73_9BACL|nr:response regulator [Cohnella rhizosphaerae]MDG0808626.1 response regulator [Cohnella rhizosphaerae]